MSGSDDHVAVTTDAVWPAEADAEEAVVINWFAREGTSVQTGETICEIQVEKVDVDVLAPVEGTLAEIVCGEDDEFVRGDTLAWIAPD
ncbi:MAG: pyruvate/2-oxoglutarate dehydrogenase complex dihydrolipoamide acyltransferase (E2) component [Haloarculaceae archaeon]|jgi:pyruvate/2-oxoglutarate dehydrogenase complex dihydrolipoamide acyltransferase (E2) component